MQGDKEKEHQEIRIMGRLLSLEAMVFLMGVASLVYGVIGRSLWNILMGGAILAAVVLFVLKCRQCHPKDDKSV